MEALQDWLVGIAMSPWVYPALFALVVVDAFLVVVPSETAVVALGAVSSSSGSPNIALLIGVAAVGAIVGDQACYGIGRWVGTERWKWMRTPRIRRALESARHTLENRAAVVLLTARYVPFARIAVNLTAGASGFSHARFTGLTAIAGVSWGIFNVAIGAGVGSWLTDQPLIAVLISVPVALVVGFTIDTVVRTLARRREKRRAGTHPGEPEAAAPPTTRRSGPLSEPLDPA